MSILQDAIKAVTIAETVKINPFQVSSYACIRFADLNNRYPVQHRRPSWLSVGANRRFTIPFSALVASSRRGFAAISFSRARAARRGTSTYSTTTADRSGSTAFGWSADMRVKDVPGFEGFYLVTDCGHLISLYRHWHDKMGRFTVRSSRVVGRWVDRSYQGYSQVILRAAGHEDHVELLHRLIAKAFLGEPPDDSYVVNHIDGNKRNNHVSNLEWCDQRGNRLHHLLAKEGVRVTAEQIREVEKLADELPAKTIAERLKIPRNSVYRILYRPTRKP